MLKAGIMILKPYVEALDTRWVVFFLLLTLVLGLFLKKLGREHIGARCFTVLYLGLVYTSTVLSRMPGSGVNVALTPLWSYAQWIQGNDVFLKYIVLNILMLLPLGVSLSALWQRPKRVLLVGFLFSCLIETSQLLTGRGLFEIDDILHNTLGVYLGILLYRLGKRPKKDPGP